jgi:hypothetical protein
VSEPVRTRQIADTGREFAGSEVASRRRRALHYIGEADAMDEQCAIVLRTELRDTKRFACSQTQHRA